jgi:3-deoxy-D-manno-octulosonic acid kinase
MNPVLIKRKSFAIACDASLMDAPGVEFFSPEYWEHRRSLVGEATGRGAAWFIAAPFGQAVLRQYLRGGWVARVSRDSYVFTTFARSRPIREFNILAELYERGLPVPRPAAALCERRGLLAGGSIMTLRIAPSDTLADLLPGAGAGPGPEPEVWERVGACIRRFHRAGVWHADLNARNILLDEARQVYLIDFDRARLMRDTEVNGKANLERLKRSLEKLWPADRRALLQPAWIRLLAGYHV